ncbi:serine hydrolase domain-containing protein [Vibrio nigripulchritudo]|uniref:serine hydrolase domain-containing protein n=1 Tax=Vibrio nigripulchritudo TaxID=28173 RepID=UPI0003B1B9AA|nr:serine hydrolase domain-containing protein [Vibrio nigripulchritudo]CCN68685.1 putative Serine-type D-Ala-D-Ala carboxypeptidase [Vibrio nigripulchritudo SFn118]
MHILNHSFTLIFAFAFLLGCSSPAKEVDNSTKLHMINHISSYGSKLGEAWSFKGEAYVLKDGKPLIHVNTESEKPETYLIGSITKPITATAVIKLAEEYKLDTEAPIGQYWHELPDNLKPLSITQLLSHTSGLGDIPSLYKIDSSNDPKDVFEDIAQSPPYFEPGTGYKYSNAAYYLLGLFIEHISKQHWLDYISETVSKPANLNSMGYGQPSVPGWVRYNAHLIHADKPAVEIGRPAGALHSSAHDLASYAYQLTIGNIVPSSQFRYMTTNHVKSSERQHGAGFRISNIAGTATAGHGGKIQGFSSRLQFSLNGHCVVVVLSNNQNFNASMLAHELLKICLTDEAVPPANEPDILVASEQFKQKVAGSYTFSSPPKAVAKLLGEKLIQDISRLSLIPKCKGIELSNDANAQPPALLFVTDDYKLIGLDTGITITSKDGFESFILSQGGLSIEYRK